MDRSIFMGYIVNGCIPRPRKRRISSGEGNFQAKLKKTHNKQFWYRFLSLLRCFLSLLHHFGVMFSIANMLHVSASCFLARRKNRHRFRVQVCEQINPGHDSKTSTNLQDFDHSKSGIIETVQTKAPSIPALHLLRHVPASVFGPCRDPN